MTLAAPSKVRSWPSFRTVWRWHFYAGLFCIPFVILLSITGSIYLFKPQIEAAIDRPYDNLPLTGPAALPSTQVQAALAAFPGATFDTYEMPQEDNSATRVLIRNKGELTRVYVHPQTSQVLHSVAENSRLMKVLFRLHGELLMGNRGSNIVEIAASWTIIMILTGLYLWWPRQRNTAGGVLYPRLFQRAPSGQSHDNTVIAGKRLFWRDIHSVTGFWISAFALFMLLTGLPWAKFWGDYFKSARKLTNTAVAQVDWTNGTGGNSDANDGGEHAMHDGGDGRRSNPAGKVADMTALDRMVPVVRPLNLAPPVLMTPIHGSHWSVKSDTQTRPLRVDLMMDGIDGSIVSRTDFGQRNLIDRIAGTGIAAHEGQLFGLPNQLLGLMTATGLILLCVSSVILWWRRRNVGVLGAPPHAVGPRAAISFFAVLLLLALYLPLFAASFVLVLLVEKLVLARIPRVSTWLGLRAIP